MHSDQPTLKAHYLTAFAILSGIVSAMSVVSLLVKYFDVGLMPIANQFIEFYRSTVAFFLDPILAYLPFRVPAWYRDAFVISLMLILLRGRADRYVSEVHSIPYVDSSLDALRRYLSERVQSIAFFIVAAFALLGLILPPYLVYSAIQVHRRRKRVFGDALAGLDPSEPKPKIVSPKLEGLKFYFRALLATVAASIAFFALNAAVG